MRRNLLMMGLILLAVGCGGPKRTSDNQTGSAVQTFAVSRAPLDSIQISVTVPKGSLESGECQASPELPIPDEATRLMMDWGPSEAPQRRVVISFDSSGDVVRYTDTRGALMNMRTRGNSGLGTSIHLDFKEGRAFIQNQSNEGTIRSNSVRLSEAMQAETLANPARTIEYVVSRCMG
jgi:hypothetical protein